MNYFAGGGGADAYNVGYVESGLSFQDKRNRNPNWTDHEIVRFLEMLQEDDSVRDLVANRNKKVFCTIAQRMCNEGTEKTWDQCRIKLKNLKSQYRYVKERIPNIDELDLEDDDVVRQLIAECQGRGISPSSIKHLRFLLRFLNKQRECSNRNGSSSDFLTTVNHPSSGALISTPQPFVHKSPRNALGQKARDDGPVSPPTSPTPGLRIISERELKPRKYEPIISINEDSSDVTNDAVNNASDSDDVDSNEPLPETGYRFIEKFNRDMMDQFMEYQRRSQASFTKWEQERWRQERESMERWRQEARQHEKQLFGMFCAAMAKCNKALTAALRAGSVRSQEQQQIREKQMLTSSRCKRRTLSSSSGKQNGEGPAKTARLEKSAADDVVDHDGGDSNGEDDEKNLEIDSNADGEGEDA